MHPLPDQRIIRRLTSSAEGMYPMRLSLAALKSMKDDRPYAVLFLMNSLYYMIVAAFMPYLPAYYRSLGFSMLQIGVLAAIGSICAILIQPVWSNLSDRLGNRLLVLRIVIAGSLVTVLLFSLPRAFIGLFLVVTLFQSFFTAIMPVQDAISLTYCNQGGRSYAGIRMGGTVGYALLVMGTGYLASTGTGMGRLVALAAVVFLAMMALTRSMPRDDSGAVRGRLTSLGTLLRNRRLVAFLMFAFAYYLGLAFIFSFVSVHIRNMGLSNQYIGYAMFIAAVSEIPVLVLIDRVLRRMSPARIMLASGLVLAVRLLLTSQATDFAGIALAQCLHGLCYMTVFYSGMQFINREVSAELKASGVGLLALIQSGLASILSSVAGGWLADRMSIPRVMLLDAVFVLIVTAVGFGVYLLRNRIPYLRPTA